jgi:hypothetical protein
MSDRTRTWRTPGQHNRRDQLTRASSGRPDQSAAKTSAPALSADARMVLDQHRAEAGTCVRCQAPWPCGPAIDAGTEGAA